MDPLSSFAGKKAFCFDFFFEGLFLIDGEIYVILLLPTFFDTCLMGLIVLTIGDMVGA
jgi:hypothetical protein